MAVDEVRVVGETWKKKKRHVCFEFSLYSLLVKGQGGEPKRRVVTCHAMPSGIDLATQAEAILKASFGVHSMFILCR